MKSGFLFSRENDTCILPSSTVFYRSQPSEEHAHIDEASSQATGTLLPIP